MNAQRPTPAPLAELRRITAENVAKDGPITEQRPPECGGCGAPMGPYEFLQWSVCMDCTKARHRGVMTKKCSCGKKKRPRTIQAFSRKWVACDRCLQQIKQLS